MSGTIALVVSIVSVLIVVARFLVDARTATRKDIRDEAAEERQQTAADDAEADRIIELKDKRIGELEKRIACLEEDQEKLIAQVKEQGRKLLALEAKLDQYGCWNAPHCGTWRPLSGPRPEGII